MSESIRDINLYFFKVEGKFCEETILLNITIPSHGLTYPGIEQYWIEVSPVHRKFVRRSLVIQSLTLAAFELNVISCLRKDVRILIDIPTYTKMTR